MAKPVPHMMSRAAQPVSPGRCAKRALDIGLSAAALVLASPVMVAVGAAVLVTLGRPVLFRSVRPGLDGEPFVLYKFRTMRPQAPGRPADPADPDDAARLTRVGRFLRASSLDELPELWNVLRGQMSLVGPRPLLTEYLPLYDADQSRRHLMRPGLTGLAQVRGRNALSWDDKLAWDIAYVDQWRFTLDLRILALTVPAVVSSRGINAPGYATAPPFTGSAPVGGTA